MIWVLEVPALMYALHSQFTEEIKNCTDENNSKLIIKKEIHKMKAEVF